MELGMYERPELVVDGHDVVYLQKDFVRTCSVCGKNTTPSQSFEVGSVVLCSHCLEKLEYIAKGGELEPPVELKLVPVDELSFKPEFLDGVLICSHCLRPVTVREINFETCLCIRCEFLEVRMHLKISEEPIA